MSFNFAGDTIFLDFRTSKGLRLSAIDSISYWAWFLSSEGGLIVKDGLLSEALNKADLLGCDAIS